MAGQPHRHGPNAIPATTDHLRPQATPVSAGHTGQLAGGDNHSPAPIAYRRSIADGIPRVSVTCITRDGMQVEVARGEIQRITAELRPAPNQGRQQSVCNSFRDESPTPGFSDS